MDFNTMDQLKKTLRALLISAKNGLSPQQLLKDYENVVGEPIPLKELGYRTLSDVIHSMPDVILVEKTFSGRTILRGVPDKYSCHISQMVSKQRNTKPYNAIKSSGQGPSQTATSRKTLSIVQKPLTRSAKEVPLSFSIKMRQLMISYPHGLPLTKFQESFNRRFGYYVKPTSWGFANITEAFDTMNDIIILSYENEGKDCIIMPATKEESLNALERSPCSVRHTEDAEDLPSVLRKSIPQLQDELVKLLHHYPSGIIVSELAQEYKKFYKEDFPSRSSVLKLINDILPEGCGLRQLDSGNKDWLLYIKGVDVTSKENIPESPSDSSKEPSKEPSEEPVMESVTVPDCYGNFLKTLIRQQSTPVFIETLPLLYKRVTNNDIPLAKLGYKSLTDMLDHTPGLEIRETSSGRLITIVNHKDTPTDMLNDKVESRDENRKPSYSSAYSHQQISNSTKSVAVYVTYVKSPSCICVQIIKEETTVALDSLHDDMALYYNSRGGEKCIIKSPIIGQPCCARFNNDGYWYRGEIIGFPHSDTVEVLYVDYGNKSVVSKASIRQPKAHYLTLPAQGLLCRLANIKPPANTWSKRASKLLFEMTKDKPIAAVVTSVVDSCLSVCLCDTTTERDIHINDFLVAQGLAIFSPDSATDVSKFDGYQLDPEPAECSSKDSNVRLPAVSSSASTVSSSLLPNPPNQTAITQQLLLNSVLLGQNLNNNLNNSSINPFLPSPLLPTPFHLMTGTNGTGIPAMVPPFQNGESSGKVVRPPPGFEDALLPTLPPLPASNPSSLSSSLTTTPEPLLPPPGFSPLSSDSDPMVLSQDPTLPPPNMFSGTSPDPSPISSPVLISPPESFVASSSEHTPDPSPSLLPEPLDITSPLSNDSNSAVCGVILDMLYIKEVKVPSPYSLNLLRCNDNLVPYILGKEISSWMWEADMLSYYLRKAKRIFPVKEISKEENPQLFESFSQSRCFLLWEVMVMDYIRLYSMEDTIKILEMFHGPESIRDAVRDALDEWEENNEMFWKSEAGILEMKLQQLQAERTTLLTEMTRSSSLSDTSIGATDLFKRFVMVDEEVKSIKSQQEQLWKANEGTRLANENDNVSEDGLDMSSNDVGGAAEDSSCGDTTLVQKDSSCLTDANCNDGDSTLKANTTTTSRDVSMTSRDVTMKSNNASLRFGDAMASSSVMLNPSVESFQSTVSNGYHNSSAPPYMLQMGSALPKQKRQAIRQKNPSKLPLFPTPVIMTQPFLPPPPRGLPPPGPLPRPGLLHSPSMMQPPFIFGIPNQPGHHSMYDRQDGIYPASSRRHHNNSSSVGAYSNVL